MTTIESLLSALESTERSVLRSAHAALQTLKKEVHPQAEALSATFVIKCYCRNMQRAERITDHYVKVITETYAGMLVRLDHPLSQHFESDMAQVIEAMHDQLLYIVSGQDPYAEVLHPMEYMFACPDAMVSPNGICTIVPVVGHIHSTGESTIALGIIFQQKDKLKRYQKFGIPRTIVPGRHYGKDSAFVKPGSQL